MANEYLTRTPTSTGNRRVWTWSGWVKINENAGYRFLFAGGSGSADRTQILSFGAIGGGIRFNNVLTTGNSDAYESTARRDYSGWMHIFAAVDTTLSKDEDRIKVFVNGIRIVNVETTYPVINQLLAVNQTAGHYIGREVHTTNPLNANIADVFLVDGQALTPDVFGFYKVGKGYISAGSAQATDFRPGQWVPKTPRVIKTAINNNGGFGVNGFYLPMNDSKNFGADFHCDPNSIITLNEKLPQPRVGVASTAVGIGYTDALRADPYAANLVLALPFVSGGLSSGFGDYAPSIKGSGSAKIMSSGSVSIASTASYYGSSAIYQNNNAYVDTPGTSGEFNMGTGDFTVEGWFNPLSTQTTNARLFGQDQNASGRWDVYIDGTSASGNIYMMGGIYQLTNTGFRGGQWNHFSMVRKNLIITTYINGVAAGIVTNYTGTIGDSTYKFRVGQIGENAAGGVGYGFQGYIQDFRVYKGVAKYTGGFDVPRPYTPVGIATWRAVPDTTANNFATMNPLIEARPSSGNNSPSNSTIVTFAGGNLDLTNSASGGNAQRMYSFATIGISTGRWYWEVRAGSNDAVAITKGFQQLNYAGVLGSGSGLEASVGYYGGGSVSIANTAYYSTATTLTPPTFDTTNIIGIAVSANSGLNNLTVQWFKDGVGVSTLTGIGATSPVLEWFPTKTASSSGSGGDIKYNFGQNPTFSGNTTAGTFTDSNSKGLFKYQPPSGFLSLCEDNLPTPAIANPGRHFRTVLYTGDGNSGRSIVGVGFTPDLVWIKSRSNAYNHGLQDSVRNIGKVLYSNFTIAEETGSVSLTSFDSNGFGLGNDSWNGSGVTYVAWCWRAGAGTTSTNTNGSITSVVSVNQDAGFSIVSYTGTAASATVGHGLGKAPGLIILKNRDDGTRNWPVYHKSFSIADFIYLNLTNAKATDNSTWGTTNSSIFTLGNGVTPNTSWNANGQRFIAYCWAEIEGFSKFGSYVGNGSADGPFVYCGFKPAWVMIKRTDSTGNWCIHDSSRGPVNVMNEQLQANLSNAESGTGGLIDFLSNGFKIRATSTDLNSSGGTYIFAAYAESPFQTANSK